MVSADLESKETVGPEQAPKGLPTSPSIWLVVFLLQVEVMEGVLKCPDTGREFPINKGIPNMLLSEEET